MSAEQLLVFVATYAVFKIVKSYFGSRKETSE